MKQIILISLTILFFNLIVEAQIDNLNKLKQSASIIQYLAEAKFQDKAPENSKYVYSKINNRQYLNAFVKVNEDIDLSYFDGMGILIGTKAGDIWTLKIPVNKVEEFTSLKKGIVHIQLDQPVYFNMDKAREKTNVDLVHEGIDLPQAFTGKDVVVGILDVGFDYTHPTFWDVKGQRYRVKRVWEQKTEGIPPSSYSYGHELKDSINIISQLTDNSKQSHGTHVAGIAAGSGRGGNGDKYKGVAFESDLVFVGITPPQDQWVNTGMTDIVDGLNYIYEYAESVGKPVIANLSWGCSIGPHDGTSLFSQAVDNLTGEGKIFTISAGNNGGNRIHINKQFSELDTILKTFLNFSTSLPDKKTWIDIWGEVGESFCIQIGNYQGTSFKGNTEFMCLENTYIDTFLIGSDNDTIFFNLTNVDADINGKPHALLDFYNKSNDYISLSIKGTSGMINLWMGYVLESTGYYGQFVSRGVPGATTGDTEMTIGEMACTESAITVGAYASKVKFTNLSGQNQSYSNYVATNNICPFSSKGPTSDGRTKPDITAPGMTIASAMNSYDIRNSIGGANEGSLVYKYVDPQTMHNYFYGELSGTSMSSPMTAGIIALLLEANPLLTTDEILTMFANTAIKDGYTKDEPNPNIWGYGKIDAYAMMESIFFSGLEENNFEYNSLYPNPTTDVLNLDWEGSKSIIVYNLIGKTCLKVLTSERTISLKNLNKGIYMVSVYNKDGKLLNNQKIVKL